MTYERLKQHLKNKTNIAYLNLNGCDIDDAMLKILAQPNLQSLSLESNKRITDKGIQAIGAKCPNLTDLNLDRCDQISDAAIKAIAKGCPKLTRLNLDYCRKISDEGIQAVFERCQNILYLNLNNSHAFHDGASNLDARAIQRSRLSYLMLDCCYVDDTILKALAQAHPNLQSLSLRFNMRVTDESLKALMQLKNLVFLDLSSAWYAREVTQKTLDDLITSNPKCVIIAPNGHRLEKNVGADQKNTASPVHAHEEKT